MQKENHQKSIEFLPLEACVYVHQVVKNQGCPAHLKATSEGLSSPLCQHVAGLSSPLESSAIQLNLVAAPIQANPAANTIFALKFNLLYRDPASQLAAYGS